MPATSSHAKTTPGLLERLKKDVVLCAEGYLFELERRGRLKAGAFVPEVVLDNPNALRELHKEFLDAGAEVIEAFTYYAHRDKLRIIGREHDLEPMNRQALRIAREVAKEGNALVAGNICNTWCYDHNDQEKSGAIVRAIYDEQCRWASEEGADFIIAETLDTVGEALIALEVIKKYHLPSVITYAAHFKDKTRDGYDWVEACKIIEKHGADVVGFNCARGPATLLPLLERLRKEVKIPIAAQPVPYATTEERPAFQHLKDRKGGNAFPLALEQHLLSRFEMADFTKECKRIGVEFIGICCGGAPYHIRAMAEALGRKPPSSRYSADLSLHGALGSDDVVKKHEKPYVKVGWTSEADGKVEHATKH